MVSDCRAGCSPTGRHEAIQGKACSSAIPFTQGHSLRAFRSDWVIHSSTIFSMALLFSLIGKESLRVATLQFLQILGLLSLCQREVHTAVCA